MPETKRVFKLATAKDDALVFDSFIDGDGDFCVTVNDEDLLYIAAKTGKLHRFHGCEGIVGITLDPDDTGRIAVAEN